MEKREHLCTIGGDVNCYSYLWRFLKKLKIELPYDSAILLLGIYLKKMKTLSRKDICTPMFIAGLLTIAKTWKQRKYLSTDKCVKKM